MGKQAVIFAAILSFFVGDVLEAQRLNYGHSLRQAVAFLTVVYRDGTTEKSSQGTAFYVGLEDERLPKGKAFGYFVTNRHVAVPMVNGLPAPIISAHIRLNLIQPNQGAESADIPLSLSGDARWFFPSDDSVDLAVLPLAPDPTVYDIRAIPVSSFATRDVVKSEGISEGDQLIFAGFFYPFPGKKRIQPLVRQGILAMSPDEEIPTTLGKDGRLYLADFHVVAGNSGSPVWVCKGGPPTPGVIVVGSGCRLLGVVSGYFYEDEELQLRPTTTLSGKGLANSGVSLVVPSDELLALLNGPLLKSMRSAAVATTGAQQR